MSDQLTLRQRLGAIIDELDHCVPDNGTTAHAIDAACEHAVAAVALMDACRFHAHPGLNSCRLVYDPATPPRSTPAATTTTRGTTA